jgi:hypothetical protein
MKRADIRFLAGGLLVAFLLAFGVSRWASTKPDGLDRVSADHGLVTATGPRSGRGSPFADYRVSGIDDPSLSTGVAGALGVSVTFCLFLGIGGLLMVRRPVDGTGRRS